jgi:predicted nucleotidyltransferase component of viral defense system
VQELQDLEKFEMETLRVLNRIRMLDRLYFGGGTMLRLCHNLNRYSTDLDFWLKSTEDPWLYFEKIRQAFSDIFTIKDAENKRNTLLLEINSPESVRNLVVEIRKDQSEFRWERRIAFSSFSKIQVVVRALTLEQMMQNKINAFLNRKLIRDCFDIESLLFRGVALNAEKERMEEMLKIMDRFTDRDFKVSLGSLLEAKDRSFCIENRFQFLREELRKKILLGRE